MRESKKRRGSKQMRTQDKSTYDDAMMNDYFVHQPKILIYKRKNINEVNKMLI